MQKVKGQLTTGVRSIPCVIHYKLTQVNNGDFNLPGPPCRNWVGLYTQFSTVLETAGVPVTGCPPIFKFIND